MEGGIRAELRHWENRLLQLNIKGIFFFNISAVQKWNELSEYMPKQKLNDNQLDVLREFSDGQKVDMGLKRITANIFGCFQS